MLPEQSIMLFFEPEIGVASTWQENLGGPCVPVDLLQPTYDADIHDVGHAVIIGRGFWLLGWRGVGRVGQVLVWVVVLGIGPRSL